MQLPKVQGQLIALNPNNGAVEALVGGYNFYQSKFNRTTQGWRQPGSIIKPFVYALALERGMTPYSMVNDSPITIGKWSPRNADGRYLGMIPLRRALVFIAVIPCQFDSYKPWALNGHANCSWTSA